MTQEEKDRINGYMDAVYNAFNFTFDWLSELTEEIELLKTDGAVVADRLRETEIRLDNIGGNLMSLRHELNRERV
jgi:hypothetical protein